MDLCEHFDTDTATLLSFDSGNKTGVLKTAITYISGIVLVGEGDKRWPDCAELMTHFESKGI